MHPDITALVQERIAALRAEFTNSAAEAMNMRARATLLDQQADGARARADELQAALNAATGAMAVPA